VVAFTEKWEAGQGEPQPPITSEWWESAQADDFYQLGVNLPPVKDGRLFEIEEKSQEHEPGWWAR
jgi:hypothetical protein